MTRRFRDTTFPDETSRNPNLNNRSMNRSLTLLLLLLLSGSAACTDDYEFHPYEPEKPAPEETVLLRYDFLTDGEASLNDFSNLENHGSWHLDERGLVFDTENDAALYLGVHRRISFEERVTRVRLSLFTDTRFGLHWLARDGKGGSLFTVDAAAGTLNIHKFGAEDRIEASIPFPIENGHIYMLEAVKSFRSNTFTITDTETGATASVATASELDSSSGGNSVEQNEFKGGRQNNLFGMRHFVGQSPFIKQVEIVASVASEPLMYLIGNSITEGDLVRETARYGQIMASWLNGRVVFSGQSGSTIDGVLDRIANEVPALRPKFVMVTIGTNGGNTREKLVELVERIRGYGAIPVLNRIPVKSDGSSDIINETIASVCEDLEVASCRFDLATAYDGDTQRQDPALFESDLLHPNAEGHYAMAKRLFDIPGVLLYTK